MAPERAKSDKHIEATSSQKKAPAWCFKYVLFGCALSFCNRGMPTSFLPLVIEDEYQQPASFVGIVMSVYPMAAFLMTPVAARFARSSKNIVQYHSKGLFLMGICALLFVSCSFIKDFFGVKVAVSSILAFRAMQGIANAIFLSANTAVMTRMFQGGELSYVVGMAEVAIACGSQSGRLFGGFLYQAGGYLYEGGDFGLPFMVIGVALAVMGVIGYRLGGTLNNQFTAAAIEGYNEYNASLPRWKTTLKDQFQRSATTSLSRGQHTVQWNTAISHYEPLLPHSIIAGANRPEEGQAEEGDVKCSKVLTPRCMVAAFSVLASYILVGFYDATLPKWLTVNLGGIKVSTLSLVISIRTLTYLFVSYGAAQLVHKNKMSLEFMIGFGSVCCITGLFLAAPQDLIMQPYALSGSDKPPSPAVWAVQIASLIFSSLGTALAFMPTLPLMQAEVRHLGQAASDQVSTLFIALMTTGEALGPIVGGALVGALGFQSATLIITAPWWPLFISVCLTYSKEEIRKRADEDHADHAGPAGLLQNSMFQELPDDVQKEVSDARDPRKGWRKTQKGFQRSATTALHRGKNFAWHSTFSPYYAL